MMNTDSLSFGLNAVNTIINYSLSRKQYKLQLSEILKFTTQFGFECERQIFRLILTAITSTSDQQRIALLQQLVADLGLFSRPNWVTLVSCALKGATGVNVNELVKCLKLNDTQRAALLVAVSEQQTNLCPGISEQLVDSLRSCDISQLNELTHFVLTQHSAENKEIIENLKRNIRVPSENCSPIEFLHLGLSEEVVPETMEGTLPGTASLNDDQIAAMLVNESVAPLTVDSLKQFNVTPKLCAKILLAICESSRPGDNVPARSEEIDNFANICREMLSSASPLTEMIQAIDEVGVGNSKMCTRLSAKSSLMFQRFWQFCANLCSTDKQGPYVISSMFFNKLWSHNIEFQFGFIVGCIRNSTKNDQLISKILSGSASVTGEGATDQIVPHLDSLKCQPDFETTPELNNWKYQRVYQILMDITSINCSPHGATNSSMFYSQMVDLFKWPLMQCPDLLTLGLLGCGNSPAPFKNEILGLVIPTFLGNHPNSAIILHTIWNTAESSTSTHWAKQILLQGMCEYYMKSNNEEQQPRLSRILDVAQDLKALSMLLNGNCYPFVIDLACLASRREYLKLDKWLMDKIQCNGEAFVSACVQFLNRRYPALFGGPSAIEANLPVSSLPPETLATMLTCLQQCMNLPGTGGGLALSISQELSETILTMVANSTRLLAKVPRQPPPGVIANPSITRPSPAVGQQPISDLGLNNLNLGSAPDSAMPGVRSQSFSSSFSQAPGPALAPQQPERLRQAVGDLSAIFPEMQQNVSLDIEEEADTYFQRIYNQSQSGSLSIDEVLEMLRRFQDSPNKREREVFTCMIRNLFKEYGFFPQYPYRELLITAQLFGGIIQMGLVKYMALVVALRYVLEALRKPHGSKMYDFGINALDRFKTKLKDYPLYCQHLASIPHFRDFPQQLIAYIEYGAQSQEPPLNASGSVSSTPLPSVMSSSNIGISSFGNSNNSVSANGSGISISTPITLPTTSSAISLAAVSSSTTATSVSSSTPRPSIANATNIDTLLAAGETIYQNPPEMMQDKVAFIINNLSQVNLTQKTEEFKEIMGKEEQYFGWISQYFVMKRASIEPNFHNLYAMFLDMLKIPELTQLILNETHRNIKVLLRSDKEIANFSDRSLLKNLGHWLGILTLAKSKPILAIDLDIKGLLIEAYHKGTQELLYVVPFIAKILESCAKSKVFKPPNPWTMGMLKALVELHQEPNLKLNLKFEVEVLLKALGVDLNDLIGKVEILKNDDIWNKLEHQLGSRKSQPQSQHQPIHSQPEPLMTHPPSPIPQLTSMHLGQHQPQMPSQTPIPTHSNTTSPGMQLFNYHDLNVTSISGLAQHITINSNLQLLNINPVLRQFIRPAIERAVQEWLMPVVERSMKISITTAEQIIKKDFALDPDENRMCIAGHYLIRNLTAGMAMITCKDPLYVSITTALKSAFTAKCPNANKDLIETTVNGIANDNIDLACCFIQKTAIEKAIPELDRKLQSEYEMRRAARAEGRRYCDPVVLTYQAERMPEAIRLKVGPVTQQQLNVYEELGKNIPGFISPISDVSTTPTRVINSLSSSIPSTVGNSGFSLSQFNPAQSSTLQPNIVSTPVGNMSGMPLSAGFGNEAPGLPQAADAALITIYEKLMAELESLRRQFHQAMQPTVLLETICNIAETLIMARQNPRDIVCALTLIQKVLDAITELLLSVDSGVADMVLVSRARDLYLVILKALSDPRAFTVQWTTKQITRIVLERLLQSGNPSLPDELLDTLIRSSLINFNLLDHQLAQFIETSNPVALNFTLQFIKLYGHQLNESDLSSTIESLVRLSKNTNVSSHPQFMVEIQQIVDVLRGGQNGVTNESSTNMIGMHPAGSQPREQQFDADPPGLLEKTEKLLREWIQLYHTQSNTSKIFQFYVQQMNLQVGTLQGILKTDDLITRFFRLSTEMCVELCYRILNQPGSSGNLIEVRSKCFHTLDAFTHLIVMLVKHSGSSNAATGAASETTAKLNLLNKVLGIIAGVALQDQDLRQAEFQHLPYYRIFVLLFMELVLGPTNLGLPGSVLFQHGQLGMGINPAQLDPLIESIQHQVLTAFCNTLHVLRPSKAPSFAFAWLDFISHRTFMEKCLFTGSVNSGTPTKGWPMYAQLLVDLIKFEAPFLRNVELLPSIDLLYKGTLKVLLVLLHDFPEFLCEYCYGLCDVIPCNAIQMRNLILSAFPRNMRLPDPFTPNLKIDQLPEISQAPKGNSPPQSLATLAQQPFKKDLDSYIRTRSPVTFLTELRGYLQQAANNASDSTHYNIPLINALILYVGQAAIQTISPKNINISSIAHSSHNDIFMNLAVSLDTEGRYLFLNAIANQLRYPNSYTHYFSCTLLYLFAETNNESIQEQITRVLLERLIVNRPHPWGLLVTFIELIKNPSFKFWNHQFVRCAPEIEKLFDSVARSCNSSNYKNNSGSGLSAPESGSMGSQTN